jgi:hypothetical protein
MNEKVIASDRPHAVSTADQPVALRARDPAAAAARSARETSPAG